MKHTGILIIIVAGLVTLYSSLFVVSEWNQALITQFGEIRGKPITTAGLHLKVPFIQDVRIYDKRILTWDGSAEQIPTKDKKYIWVDTTARWKIGDPVLFAQTVIEENGAQNRLDGILDGITRDTISNHNLVEAVRNTNQIIDRAAAKKSEQKSAEELADQDQLTAAVEEEVTGEIEKISVGRENLSKIIIQRAREELKAFGIELIDVQLRRIAYEKSVEDKVYDRMISERNRIAEKIRSIGKGEEASINGKRSLDLKEIQSVAYRKSQEIKGKAEAEATTIYASELSQDPAFYEFTRTLEAYKKTIPNKAQMILSADSEFLKYLK